MRKTKGDILMRREMFASESFPQINVKVYKSFEPLIERVRKECGAGDDLAREAVQTAFEFACEDFWAYWQQTYPFTKDDCGESVGYYFPGYDATVECEGRQGGHLVVKGLLPVASWDAIMVMRWWRFVAAVESDIEYRIDDDALMGCIDANDLATPAPLRYLQEVA